MEIEFWTAAEYVACAVALVAVAAFALAVMTLFREVTWSAASDEYDDMAAW